MSSDARFATAGDWAHAIDEMWHRPGGRQLVEHDRRSGRIAGIPLCCQTWDTSEDDGAIFVSADGAWTVVLDPASNSCRAIASLGSVSRSVRLPETPLLSRPADSAVVASVPIQADGSAAFTQFVGRKSRS